jgi:shikimate kinase
MQRGNIFLVGMMGAGKTTVGRALAQKMQMRFADSDKVLVERTGVPRGRGRLPAPRDAGARRAR